MHTGGQNLPKKINIYVPQFETLENTEYYLPSFLKMEGTSYLMIVVSE